MQRKLSMRKIAELLRLKYELKLPHRAIAASLNISAGTVSNYIKQLEAAEITWPLPTELTEEQLHQKLFPKAYAPIQPLPDWKVVHQELRRKGVTLHLLWQEYSENSPNVLSYSQFCRLYRQEQKQFDPVMRLTHRAGENCFVDYAGLTVPWIDRSTGEIFQAQIFVGCLGASNYTYVEATAGQTLREWLTSHANMFAYFGGVPQNCVPDNLKAAVTKTHRYDPDLNLTYQHFAAYYGVAILPARVAKPRDKAKVENAVQCIERQLLAPLRHRTFTSLAEINRALQSGLVSYNAKPFQKLPGSSESLFKTLDKPALKLLPPNAYEWSDWRQAKVRATTTSIECYHELTRIACHRRRYRGGFTTLI